MKKMILLTVLLLGFACNPFSQVDAAEAGMAIPQALKLAFTNHRHPLVLTVRLKKQGQGKLMTRKTGLMRKQRMQINLASCHGLVQRKLGFAAWPAC
ncbi:hypothetical protein FAM18132_00148 [Lacticaseibacillus paracasei]|jgi:hypothetical protein|uniref:Uncharacterized protein n=2 Tax=Lacticaseibacillus paracasei subsp. paracasei TaxID=47714 RepID=A0A829H5E8_LACPA|nr:hypothetical protein FAM18149p_12660 [Lacticaseibacillus paracasei]EKQ24551.1 hypothetical protein LCAUW4_0182 [Lacticaseibacillus casei UW4]EPC24079.1 cell surface complex protein [Lacticaseibacillus paracasei subsp. paracasei Lpp22]EPC71484.1 hypothetical protein Lpp41_11678 [Lacticaseibacillus paracasei subsp. paracasei Lpp41]RND42195.1 hypothetical protein FAM18101_00173 [Lacticaseibacillus paracasei]